jgi:heterodisulfide reductase subunit B
MKYTYYPGCSVMATANLYQESIDAVSEELGIEFEELDDWNCCGATAYMSVKELMSFAISARNLALAEPFHRDLVTACSACYTVLNKTNRYFNEYPDLRKKLSTVLDAAGLNYGGTVRVRHLLDVLVNDVGFERIAGVSTHKLTGLRVAPYYGCQIVRPDVEFDDPDDPQSMDRLVEAVGATPVKFPLKTHCCGAALMGTQEKLALGLCKDLLLDARIHGAHCLITICPLCQMNLDVYQGKVNALFGMNFRIPVMYVTQLIGLSLGIPFKTLGLHRLAVKATPSVMKFVEGA